MQTFMGEEMEDKFEQVFSQCGQTSHVYFQCSSLLFCEQDPVNGSKTTKSHPSHDFIVTRQIKQTCQYNDTLRRMTETNNCNNWTSMLLTW